MFPQRRMVGRVGWLLVVGWAWSAGWRVLATQGQCDVQALRCDVICSFPDLDVHCSRCIRRRPMRFGKRSGEAADPVGEAQPAGPLLTKLFSLGSGSLHSNRSHKKKSTFAISRMQDGRASAGVRPVQDSGFLNVGLRQFLNKFLRNDAVRKDDPPREVQKTHVNELLPGLYPRGLHGDLHIDIDDSNDVAENRRRRRSVPNIFSRSDTAGMATSGGPSRPRTFPVFRKSKRSGVHEVIEGLMELLGLEELPVDPTLYGCHELLLPLFK